MNQRRSLQRSWRKAMRCAAGVFALAVAAASAGCTPDWATSNETPFILEIARIAGPGGATPFLSDVSFPVTNDEAQVTVNVFRKNNTPDMSTSPVEHVYLTRYEVRYFRTDGRDVEGVDVPFRVTGPLGNLRFHTASPGGGGEVEQTINLTLVRQQAKLESPLANLRGGTLTDTGASQLPNAAVLTLIAEVTIFGETVQGKGLKATGNVQVTFADFPDQ
jgi:hypothetical protein